MSDAAKEALAKLADAKGAWADRVAALDTLSEQLSKEGNTFQLLLGAALPRALALQLTDRRVAVFKAACSCWAHFVRFRTGPWREDELACLSSCLDASGAALSETVAGMLMEVLTVYADHTLEGRLGEDCVFLLLCGRAADTKAPSPQRKRCFIGVGTLLSGAHSRWAALHEQWMDQTQSFGDALKTLLSQGTSDRDEIVRTSARECLIALHKADKSAAQQILLKMPASARALFRKQLLAGMVSASPSDQSGVSPSSSSAASPAKDSR